MLWWGTRDPSWRWSGGALALSEAPLAALAGADALLPMAGPPQAVASRRAGPGTLAGPPPLFATGFGEPLGSGAARPLWLHAEASEPKGLFSYMKWQVVVFPDGKAAWALPDVFATTVGPFVQQGMVDVKKETQKLRFDLEVWSKVIDFDLKEMYFPSRREAAHRMRHNEAPTVQRACQHTSVSTPLLLLAVCFWSVEKKKLAARHLARSALDAALRRLLPPGASESLAAELGELGGYQDLCFSAPPSGCCGHILALPKLENTATALNITDFMAKAAANAWSCRSCGALLLDVCRACGEDADEALLSGNPALDDRVLANVQDQLRKGKAVDRYVRWRLRDEALRKRRVQGQAVLGEALGIGESTAWRWRHDDLLVQTRCHWRSLAQPSVFIIKEDATRMGSPAKETVHYILRGCAADISMFLAPQASSRLSSAQENVFFQI